MELFSTALAYDVTSGMSVTVRACMVCRAGREALTTTTTTRTGQLPSAAFTRQRRSSLSAIHAPVYRAAIFKDKFEKSGGVFEVCAILSETLSAVQKKF